MAQSSIEWTELTWNPVTGCTKISDGCKFCYAEVMTRRLKAMGLEKYKDGFKVRIHPITLADPFEWKGSKMIFVNSMSDLFHEDVPSWYIHEVFKTMAKNPQHTFQILTKRTDRVFDLNNELNWSKNIWMGTSIENNKVIDRLEYLKRTDAKTKFLSCEPLIGSLSGISFSGIDWVIVGGESGRSPRPMKKDWVIEIKNQCLLDNVPFFFKQWGGTNKKKAGRELDGETYNEMPI